MKSTVAAVAVAMISINVVAAAPATAGSPTAAQGADSAALAAADRLLVAMGYDKMMDRSVDSMISQSGPALKRSIEAELGTEVGDDLIKRMQKVQAEYLRKLIVNNSELRRAMATLYAHHFTAPELDHLAQLYSDPVMRKWADSAPALMGAMMPLMIDLMSAHRNELQARLKSVAEEYFAQKPAPNEG